MVSPTACITIPGNWSSKIAEIAPKNNPWLNAYKGAVTGAQVFLKMVAKAKPNPKKAYPSNRNFLVGGLTGIYCGMRAEGLIDARLLGDVRFLNFGRKPALV